MAQISRLRGLRSRAGGGGADANHSAGVDQLERIDSGQPTVVALAGDPLALLGVSMAGARYLSLYQINCRIWLIDLSRSLKGWATLVA